MTTHSASVEKWERAALRLGEPSGRSRPNSTTALNTRVRHSLLRDRWSYGQQKPVQAGRNLDQRRAKANAHPYENLAPPS